jgi:hypothetical protein
MLQDGRATEPPVGSSTVKKMGPVHLGRRPRWMRDRGPARCEPTGYKVRRALARRWQRPSPRNIEHKHIPCRSFLTGSAPYKGGGRRCGGRPGRQVRARCRRAASPSPSAGVGPRARRRAWRNPLARSRGAPGSARGCAGGGRPSPADVGPPASGPGGHGRRTTWWDSAPPQAGTRRPHPTPSLAQNYGPQTGRGLFTEGE